MPLSGKWNQLDQKADHPNVREKRRGGRRGWREHRIDPRLFKRFIDYQYLHLYYNSGTGKSPVDMRNRRGHPAGNTATFQLAQFSVTRTISGLKDIGTWFILRKQVFLRIELEILVIGHRIEVIGEVN